jgi:hypothetical protein
MNKEQENQLVSLLLPMTSTELREAQSVVERRIIVTQFACGTSIEKIANGHSTLLAPDVEHLLMLEVARMFNVEKSTENTCKRRKVR